MAKKTSPKVGTNSKEGGSQAQIQAVAEQARGTSDGARTASDRVQGFSFRAPEAGSVQLVGDFTHWEEKPISLKKEAGGLWRASVPLSPGEHHYRFLVDGEWRDDPDCAVRVPNPFGSQNMMRKVA